MHNVVDEIAAVCPVNDTVPYTGANPVPAVAFPLYVVAVPLITRLRPRKKSLTRKLVVPMSRVLSLNGLNAVFVSTAHLHALFTPKQNPCCAPVPACCVWSSKYPSPAT